jgi:hypothetical protein
MGPGAGDGGLPANDRQLTDDPAANLELKRRRMGSTEHHTGGRDEIKAEPGGDGDKSSEMDLLQMFGSGVTGSDDEAVDSEQRQRASDNTEQCDSDSDDDGQEEEEENDELEQQRLRRLASFEGLDEPPPEPSRGYLVHHASVALPPRALATTPAPLILADALGDDSDLGSLLLGMPTDGQRVCLTASGEAAPERKPQAQESDMARAAGLSRMPRVPAHSVALLPAAADSGCGIALPWQSWFRGLDAGGLCLLAVLPGRRGWSGHAVIRLGQAGGDGAEAAAAGNVDAGQQQPQETVVTMADGAGGPSGQQERQQQCAVAVPDPVARSDGMLAGQGEMALLGIMARKVRGLCVTSVRPRGAYASARVCL